MIKRMIKQVRQLDEPSLQMEHELLMLGALVHRESRPTSDCVVGIRRRLVGHVVRAVDGGGAARTNGDWGAVWVMTLMVEGDCSRVGVLASVVAS
jgi:hypothetical protein